MKKHSISLLLVGCCLHTASGNATPADMPGPLDFRAIYECSMGGISVGKMGVEIQQTPNHYTTVDDVLATGIVKLVVNHTSHSVAEGSGQNYRYPSIEYETHYQTNKKKRSVKMTYKGGKIVEEEVLPANNPDKRPPVPEELKNVASDPLSLILKMRQAVYAAYKNGSDAFDLNLYDGRRLTQIDFIMLGEKDIPYYDKSVPTIAVQASRKLIAGFSTSERENFNPDEAPLVIYFSNDKRFMPIRLETSLWIGTLSAVLVKECAAGESCLFGNSE